MRNLTVLWTPTGSATRGYKEIARARHWKGGGGGGWFARPALLVEAITHLSYGAGPLSTSYQRPKFLDDALCIGASVDLILTSTTRVERKKRKIALHKFLCHSHSEIPARTRPARSGITTA